MKKTNTRYSIILVVTIIVCSISCNILRKQPIYHDLDEPYEYVNTLFPSNDTIFIATIQNDSFNGPIKVKKQQGNYLGGMYDKVYEDAYNVNGWTCGHYKMNKKHGEWYCLNKDGSKILSIEYKNDILDGQYLHLLNNGKDTLIYCNYSDGILHGKYVFNEGNGIINGTSLYGKHHWELNYHKGQLDGIQRKYFDGTLEEEFIYNLGAIEEIKFSTSITDHKISKNGDGYISLHKASFAFGILGRQFCKKHNERTDLDIFGDHIFTGKIKLCNGYFCPGELILYSEISKKEHSFRINYNVSVERN